MKTKVILAVMFSLFIFSFADAQRKGNSKKSSFMNMDTNKDGRISLSEFETFRPMKKGIKDDEAIFKRYDVNNDGVISLEEVQNKNSGNKKSKILTFFESLDTNNDKLLTLAEFKERKALMALKVKERKAKRFAEIDTNKDGFLTKEEFDTYHKQRQIDRFNSVDTDGNGCLSAEEFLKMGKGKKRK